MDYDYLHLCENCQDAYTLGRLCTSCALQAMIDAAEMWVDGEYIGKDLYWWKRNVEGDEE